MRKEVSRHDFKDDNGALYVVVEYQFELIAKDIDGTKQGWGSKSFNLADGRDLIEIDGDDEPNAFKIAATGEVIRRV